MVLSTVGCYLKSGALYHMQDMHYGTQCCWLLLGEWCTVSGAGHALWYSVLLAADELGTYVLVQLRLSGTLVLMMHQ